MTAADPSISETITAVATGWTRSYRAVIRLSGEGTRELCTRLFDRVPDAPGSVVATRFRLTDTLSLPCMLMRYDAPRSYTGEDAAEMVVPGNPLLLERIIARLVSQPNVREATPGEFSARAYLGGRMTLAQAEGVAALIAAENDEQLAAAAALMSGSAGETHRRWADAAANLLALVEAGIDFTDQEDVVPIAPALLTARLDALIAEFTTQLGAIAGTERLAGLPRVVLVGPPNAGKSTLFNALLGRQRAMVSSVAGTTRDALVEELDLSAHAAAGSRVELVDLAGLEAAASDPSIIDFQAQRQAHAEVERADVLLLCDPRGRFDALPTLPLRPPPSADRALIRVRTKADLPLTDCTTLGTREVIGVCALDGWNLGVLRRAIADAAAGSGTAGGSWMLPRHRRTLAAAATLLHSARATVDPTAHALRSPELVAGDLRSAVDQLGELVGDISPDDIIGRVFSTFCVGK